MFAEHADLVSRYLGERPGPGVFDLHIRNMWPAKTDHMVGARNVYVCFAWEELEFPQYVVDAFNRTLDAVLTTSTFVTECLLHSGVTVPTHTVGLGTDHIPTAAPRPRLASDPARLLHVSSGFARKGVDVLAHAFASEFRADEEVELYVKTTPDSLNVAEREIARAAEQNPDAAPMLIDEWPLTDDGMTALYRSATALVGPSRAEGFGLPFAEAMRAGVPVVTTGHGGSRDFCTHETAFLVDATLSPSRSHLASLHSVWAEPDAASLAARMREAIEQPELATAKVLAGQALLEAHFTWEQVLKRIAIALHGPAAAEPEPAAEIDIVLGAAAGGASSAHARRLSGAAPIKARTRNVFPIEDGAAALCDAIAATDGGVLWIHHDPELLHQAALGSIAVAVRRSRHRLRALSIDDVSDIDPAWLEVFDVVFTPTAEACAAASRAGAKNPVVLPFGAKILRGEDRARVSGDFEVAIFGRPAPDDHIRTIAQAAAFARHAVPALKLAVICETSGQAARATEICRDVRVGDMAVAEVAPADGPALVARLATCDLIAIAARRGDSGYEAVIRTALAADRPLLCALEAMLPNAPRYAHAPRSWAAMDLAGAIGSLAGRADARHGLDVARRQVAGWFDLDRIAFRFLYHLARRD